jgi:hypothetical protein
MDMSTIASAPTYENSRLIKLADFLGAFSLFLGFTELLFGGGFSHQIGLGGLDMLVRIYGVREIVTGILILASRNKTPWIWLRVAGDALDIATLGWASMRDPNVMSTIMIANLTVLPIVILDIVCAIKLTKRSRS